MRLLSLALAAVVITGVAADPGKGPPNGSKGSKDEMDCPSVLANFRSMRDTCLSDLAISPTIFPIVPDEATLPTAAPVTPTQTPTTASPTKVPTTAAPTDAPTNAPSNVPTMTPTPAPDTAETACMIGGDCWMFVSNAMMWREQIQDCLQDEAEGTTDPLLMELEHELQWAMDLVNAGCSMNDMGDTCADDFASITCPATQGDLATLVSTYGCCVATFEKLQMEYSMLTGMADWCPALDMKSPPKDWKLGKPCKAPKWKAPLNPPPPPPAGLGKKGKGAIAGGILGGLAGLGAAGWAIRRRKANLAAPKTARKVEMAAPTVVAV